MALCLVNTPEDLVIIISEECTKCSDRKLGVLQRWPLPVEELDKRKAITAIKQACGFSISTARAYYEARRDSKAKKTKFGANSGNNGNSGNQDDPDTKKEPFHEELWMGPRQVRVRCDC